MTDMTRAPLTVEQRRAIFRAIIEAQDGGASVAQSRDDVAKLFSTTEEIVKDVEREGLDGQWPPL